MMAPPQKRQRTELQLARKREADRVGQRAKREQAKRHMDHLESRLEKLQNLVESLSDQLETMNAELRRRNTCCCPPSRHPPNNISSSIATRPAVGINTVLASSPEVSSRAGLSTIDCRCGVDHRDQSECLEYSTFTILFKAHETLAEGRDLHITQWLPRTPSLVSIFSPSASTNPIIRNLGSFFRQVHPTNVCTLLACCLMMYRYLRWRLYPDKETFEDIPTWLQPTESQKIIPHPICIDFMPWPNLRDYVIKHQNNDPRQSVWQYIRSVRFRWPADRRFYSMSPQGELLLDREFEAAMYVYDNWRLSREWADMFPRLKRFVNLEEET